MKQLGYRALMVLCFIALLAGGTLLFCGRYVADGADWAASKVNSGVYESGRLRRGAVYDRSGVLLYDAASGAYAADKTVRKATLHLVGDRAGNIASSALKSMADALVGFSPITGTASGGSDLTLTVDAGLCAAAYEALDGKKGAIALCNYQTGEILCSVSTPTFDPENPPDNVEGNSKYEGVYINRVFGGLYAPGSTFKIVTAAAALEQLPDVESRSFHCDGSLTVGDQKITCPYAHGDMDLAGAMAKSCNGVFAALAAELGSGTLQEYFDAAGLSAGMTVSDIRTAAGSFTAAESEGDTGWSGVGQYQDLVNPAGMLRLVSAIANGGRAPGLRLTDASGESFTLAWEQSTCTRLKELLRGDVVDGYGQEQFGELSVCAKSGTAEVGEGKRPHAWFVGFVDDEALPLAFVVVVENGGSGAKVAGGAAAKLLAAAAKTLTAAAE